MASVIGAVLPYAQLNSLTSGSTSSMIGTTTTQIIASPGAPLTNYITNILATNGHATQGTYIRIQDGSGGTTIYEGYAAAAGGGFSVSFPAPLKQPSSVAGLFAVNVTTGSNTIVSASGFKAP